MSDNQTQFWDDFFKRRHWPQHALADLMNVSDDVVSRWRNGKSRMNARHLNELMETGVLSEDESSRLTKVWLEGQGFGDTALARFLGSAGVGTPASQAPRMTSARRLLILTPFVGSNPAFYSLILGSLTDIAQRAGVDVVIQGIPDVQVRRQSNIHLPHLEGFIGCIAITCHVHENDWHEELARSGIPVILVHDNSPLDQLASNFRASLWEDMIGIRRAVQHLIKDHGCQRLKVVIANPQNHFHRQRKVNSVVEAAHELSVQVNPYSDVLPLPRYSFRIGLESAELLLGGHAQPDAVVCFNDEIALAMHQTIQRTMSKTLITSFDNTSLAEHFGISSVDTHISSIAEIAFSLLSDGAKVSDRTSLMPYYLPTTFQRRPSCCRVDGALVSL